MTDTFGMEVRDLWRQGEEADKKNREEALYDLKFAAGEQWDDRVKQYRESGDRPFPLPCLTINTLPQFVGQVVGDRRANQTSVKVLPKESGNKKVAEVRSEMIRSIEYHSKAERVYTQTFENQVTCGIGNFRVDLDYADDDSFNRALFIRGIPNPMAVNWDPLASDPTGKDAAWCFVTDLMTTAAYEKRFPKAAKPSGFDTDLKATGWIENDTVRVAEYLKLEEREREIAMFMDGTVRDIKDAKPGDLFLGPDGKPLTRKAKVKYAVSVMTNGQEQLTDPFELKLPRLPIIRAMGREVWVGDKRVRFGLVRFARDPQRLKNYWRSVVAELLMGATRANYMAEASAVKGRAKDWANTLVFNDGTPMPKEITGTNLAAIINEAQMCAQDMKDTTGLHDASLGIQSNETSGVAIQRRQNEGDIASIGYHDNMNAAMQEGGEVLNCLLDLVHDTAGTVRLIGEDGNARMQKVNDPNDEESVMLGQGKYDVVISTGPAYMTRRQEAAAGMLEFARSSPSVMERAGDLIAKSQDWPLADEFADRLRPPGAGDDGDLSEEKLAEQQQQAELAQQMAAMEMKAKEAELRTAEANARKAEAEAEKAQTEAAKAKTELAMQGAELAGLASGEIVPQIERQEEIPA